MIAQYALKTSTGTERDQYLEYKATRTITEFFAWRGLGVVDRSEFAPGKLNIFTLGPDPAKAVAGLKTVPARSEAGLHEAQHRSGALWRSPCRQAKHPLPAKAPFSLD